MGLTIDDKNINTDLNKYGEKITVINDGEDDDDDKENAYIIERIVYAWYNVNNDILYCIFIK